MRQTSYGLTDRYQHLLAVPESHWSGLHGTLDHIPPQLIVHPGVFGDYSLKGAMCLMAVSKNATARNIGAISNSEQRIHTWGRESVEQREVAVRSDWSITDVLADRNHNHDRLLSTLQDASRTTDDDLLHVEEAIHESTWEQSDSYRLLIMSSFLSA